MIFSSDSNILVMLKLSYAFQFISSACYSFSLYIFFVLLQSVNPGAYVVNDSVILSVSQQQLK